MRRIGFTSVLVIIFAGAALTADATPASEPTAINLTQWGQSAAWGCIARAAARSRSVCSTYRTTPAATGQPSWASAAE